MSDEQKNAETPSNEEGKTTEETTPAPAEATGDEAVKTEPVDADADTLAEEEEEAPAAEANEDEKEEEKKIAYELVEATPRAGSIVDLKIRVPYSEYDEKTKDFYKELRQSVVIDGFRRGKAPLKLIQNRYQKQVKQDTLDFLLENALGQISDERDYQFLHQIDRVDPEVTEGQDLEFSASFEIRPQVDPTGYEGVEVTIDTFEVNDAAVSTEVERIRRRHATYQASELLSWEPGHGVTLDIEVRDDTGVEDKELCREDVFLTRPENSLPEQVVEELRGKSAGETFTVRVPNVRKSEGGVVTSEQDRYVVKVKEVKREVVPELDDEFAKDLGLESLDELKAQIRDQLQQRQEQQERDDALEKIYTELFERNEMDVPETLVSETQGQMLREHEQRLRNLGFRLEDLGEDPREYIVRTRDNAERLVRMLILNQAIAKKEEVEATDADVDKAIERRAAQQGRRPLAIRAHLEAHNQLDRFKDDLKYDLVNDLLLEKAKINKQYVSPESKLSG